MNKLRVWHIPQIPGKAFFVDVSSVEEGVRMMSALTDYDAFLYDNKVRPDHSNANGLQMFDESLTDQDLDDMELNNRWVDWCSDCKCYDDPMEYLESLKKGEPS
ncbi:superinfection exclusion protein [Citrobacter werkmanii]|uniref:superinfection exclusion protein n=1 Tax=Citrobacter werkmanii TaxID=67827 RepID=UPI001900C5DC|nr:superinfection exclusion protein [Citrobacter werkmanii]MBJ9293554.1 superinfection exclusion protein [Citrobacter werkmanii]